MDGRKAAFNVIVGVILGAALPMVAAVALAVAFDGFRPLDHPFTMLFLCLVCSSIGVLVNLPWSAASHSTHVFTPDEPPPHDRSALGADAPPEEPDPRQTTDDPPHRHDPHARPKRYAMSRREALRELALEHDADEDAVREAFRRLVKEHHPDQANALGPEAVAEATRRFVRIREAYEVLIDEA